MKNSLFVVSTLILIIISLRVQILRSDRTSMKPYLIRHNRPRGEGHVKSEFITSKVKVFLSCEPEETMINLNFTEPFRGVVQAGDSQSPCRIRGDGKLFYVLRVPHNSCGTQHVSQRTAAQSQADVPNPNTSGLSGREAEDMERKRTENVVKLAATDQLNSEIVTNRTKAYLSCESGEMIVKINFSEPFRGVAYADYDRSSPCKFYGDGRRYYEMRMPLKGCGTKQEAPRIFINNIIVRFHRSLELEEDEIKTIICRYPPPLAPPPPSITAPVLYPPPPPVPLIPAKLSEVELLLIICALLFLTLLLLGVGIGYYCLKRRNIKVIRKRKILSSGPPSEITKISSTFEPIRIPRAMAPSSSSSEPLVPSDYPSDSPSSDERRSVVSETSTVRHDHYRYENSAFVPEPYPPDIEKEESVSSFPVPVVAKPNITKQDYLTTILETEHLTEEDIFNTKHQRTTTKLYKKLPPVYAKIKRKPASIPDNDNRSASEYTEDVPMRAPSISSTPPSLYGSIPDNDDWSHTELDEGPDRRPYVKPPKLETLNIDDYFITKQHTTDIHDDITTKRTVAYPQPKVTTKSVDDYYKRTQQTTDIEDDTTTRRTVAYPQPKVTTKSVDDYYKRTQRTTDIEDDTTTRRTVAYPQPKVTTKSVDDYFVNTQRTTDIEDDTTTKRQITYPQPKITTKGVDDYYVDTRETTDIEEDKTSKRITKYPQPKIVVRSTDDLFVTNITETETTEHTIKQTKKKPPAPQPPYEGPDRRVPRYPVTMTRELPETRITDTRLTDTRITDTGTWESTTYEHTPVQLRPPSGPKYNVIIRIIDQPPPIDGVERLTPQVKHTFRTIITTDEIFRSLIIESTTVEEYVRISRDVRYERIFEPPTWRVIIRILSLPEVVSVPIDEHPVQDVRPPPRYKKEPKRKGSLPSLVEDIHYEPHGPGSVRSRRTSRSGSVFDNDVRSLTEEDVDFARYGRDSPLWSQDIGYYTRTRMGSSYLEDVPIDPSVRRHYVPRTTNLSEYVHPDYPNYPHTRESPQLEALSLALPQSYPLYHSSSGYVRSGRSHYSTQERSFATPLRQTLDRTSSVGEREEIKSMTETDVYDWLRH